MNRLAFAAIVAFAAALAATLAVVMTSPPVVVVTPAAVLYDDAEPTPEQMRAAYARIAEEL